MVAALATTLVVAAGVQGLVGLGLGLVAAPVITLLEPTLMPELMLWLALMMPLVTLVREHHEIDWFGLGWSLPARVVGTALGVLVVASVSTAGLGVAVGAMVLLSVVLTVRAVRVPVNVGSLTVAGFVSGVAGTATSIGGPPIAILYQHRSPAQIRSTLGIYFTVGAALSLIGLGLAGVLEQRSLFLALLLAPALVLGFLVSRVLDRRLPRHHVRTGVLLVCAISSVVLLVRSLFTL